MIGRLLVPTDFSVHAQAALSYALKLAASLRAQVHVLHVVENPIETMPESSRVNRAEVASLELSLVRNAAALLRRHIRAVDATAVVLSHDVRLGRAAEVIVEFADDHGIDLIVMGTRGEGDEYDGIAGSVAAHVVRTAPCPVLTLRAAPVAGASSATRTAVTLEW